MGWGVFWKKCVRLFCFALALGAAGCLSDFEEWELKAVQDPEIDEIVSKPVTSNQIVGMGFGIVHRGAIVYLRGYGWADREKRKEVDPFTTLFRWASISKTITGTMAGVALEHGWIDDVDRDIRAYYPEFPHEGITLRHLVSHQSGIIHYLSTDVDPTPPKDLLNDPNHNTGIAWALPYWWHAPLLFEPGTQLEYSSLAFNMAGAVIERASGTGKSFAELVEEHVSIPAGLESLQPGYGWKKIPGRSKGYLLWKLNSGPLKENTRDDISWKLPSGGFISSVRDMARYCRAWNGDELISLETRRLLTQKNVLKDGEITDFGMGWIVGRKGKRQYFWHNGRHNGATTLLMLYPEEDLCFVVLSNTRAYGARAGEIQLGTLVRRVDDLLAQRRAAGEPMIQSVVAPKALQEAPTRY